MTPELLAGAVAVILSLLASYVPGLNVWFAALKSEIKQLIMLGMLVVVAGASYGLACWGVLQDLTGIVMSCDKAGLLELIRVFVMAVIANQGAYLISPQPQAVRLAKEQRAAG